MVYFEELLGQSRQMKEDLAKNIFLENSVWQRLKRLPIYLDMKGEGKTYHISDPKLEEKAPKEREIFIRLIKEYPSIIDEIEKHPYLEQIIFTSEILPAYHGQENIPFTKRRSLSAGRTITQKEREKELPKTIAQQIQKSENIVAIALRPRPYSFLRKGKDLEVIADTLFHELRHVGQEETYRKEPSRIESLFKGEYREQKGEKQARESAKEKIEESSEKQVEEYRKQIEGDIKTSGVREAILKANLSLKKAI